MTNRDVKTNHVLNYSPCSIPNNTAHNHAPSVLQTLCQYYPLSLFSSFQLARPRLHAACKGQ